jgi:hypothetical protein
MTLYHVDCPHCGSHVEFRGETKLPCVCEPKVMKKVVDGKVEWEKTLTSRGVQ